MKNVVIGMMVGSARSTQPLVYRAISSIIENIGTSNYLIIIGISTQIGQDIINTLERFSENSNNRIVITTAYSHSFASFINYVIRVFTINSKWFLFVHDDIELITKDFIPTVEAKLETIQSDIGWISFTDNDYLSGHWAPSTRPGYHYDFVYENAWNNRQMFQFHKLIRRWPDRYADVINDDILDFDFPSDIVKCHAPFSHFTMIETEKLKTIGMCEEWSEVSLLIDEDWGLSALKSGMFNIWIPDIIYNHYRKSGTTRAQPIIHRIGAKVHRFFENKWGFNVRPSETKKTIKVVQDKYSNTNIPWSIGRRSFEWDYVK
ncbi:MAG: hypothetical protein ACXAC2_05785 [Candidatus Kariarchaeaceae archaeon]|jgi:hypothetical protein